MENPNERYQERRKLHWLLDCFRCPIFGTLETLGEYRRVYSVSGIKTCVKVYRFPPRPDVARRCLIYRTLGTCRSLSSWYIT